MFRRIEFRFDNPADDSPLRERPSVAQVIDTMESFEGIAVRVEITMGHAEGTLDPNAVKRFGHWLSRLGEVEVGDDTEVRSAKVVGADNEGDTYEELDLLKARLSFEFEANQTHRRLNPRSCRQGLMRAFDGGYSRIVRRQLRGRLRDEH